MRTMLVLRPFGIIVNMWPGTLINGPFDFDSRGSFKIAVADQKPSTALRPDEEIEINSSDSDEWFWIPWEDSLPLDWPHSCSPGVGNIPGLFLQSIVTWICAAERMPGRVRDLSDFELVFALHFDSSFAFPFSVDGSQHLELREPGSLFQRPTLVMMLRPVQKAMAQLHHLFPQTVIRLAPHPRTELGVYTKFAGTRIHFPDQLWLTICERIKAFTANRAVRRCSDLSRPLT